MKKMDIRTYAILGILAFVGFSVLTFVLPATAQDQASGTSAPSKPEKKAEIVVDEASGVIRILIEGEPKLIIDSSGIQVFGDVKYTGVTSDNGGKFEKEPTHAQ